MPRSILVVDDEPGMRLGLRETLKKEGYKVSAAADGEKAIQLLDQNPFDLVLTDGEIVFPIPTDFRATENGVKTSEGKKTSLTGTEAA